MPSPILLSRHDVARALGVSVRTLHRLVVAGQFPPPVAMPGQAKNTHWKAREVEEWAERLKPAARN